MTDEEKAEEYTKLNARQYIHNDGIGFCTSEEEVKQAYLAGLKAGRPQWHDLRKDPNDLPKNNDEKLCFYGKGKVVARYNSECDCWDTYFNNFVMIPSGVIIAWAEISKFEETDE